MDKEHILAEIRRTTRENGGKPLGKNRFFQETGIKETDWDSRYWPRWSDAVREAGFAPNTLQAAYTEAYLLDKFIKFIRELGRFPVRGEVRIKRRQDATFPADNVFWHRFGGKPGLAARIVEHCRTEPGLEDVAELCGAVLAATPEPKASAHTEEQLGYVYLSKSGRHYKIGKTNAVGRRERELAIQLPEKARTVHVIKTDDPAGIEAYWHKRFAPKRKNGEWFELNAEDLRAFRRRKFM